MRKSSLIIGLLLLTGCTYSQDGVTRNDLIDTAFVSTVKEEVDISMSFDEIVEMGEESCKTNDLFDAIHEVEQKGFSKYDAPYIVGAAWAAYCPENSERYK